MSASSLRINGVVVTSLDLRRDALGQVEVVIRDPWCGEFPLASSCLIEYMDPTAGPYGGSAWIRLTYPELVAVMAPFLPEARARVI